MSEQNLKFYKMYVSVPRGNLFGIQVPASSLNGKFYKMYVSVPSGILFGIQVPASSLNGHN
jgi:hypothetical protein